MPSACRLLHLNSTYGIPSVMKPKSEPSRCRRMRFAPMDTSVGLVLLDLCGTCGPVSHFLGGRHRLRKLVEVRADAPTPAARLGSARPFLQWNCESTSLIPFCRSDLMYGSG